MRSCWCCREHLIFWLWKLIGAPIIIRANPGHKLKRGATVITPMGTYKYLGYRFKCHRGRLKELNPRILGQRVDVIIEDEYK